MLCLVLVAYWSSAIAEDTYLPPNNNSQSKEESSLTSTISVDPWSPVVGDTEGVPGVTARVESVHGRRAAINLVENIRRQLMRDNYDYISDESEESSMIKTPSPSQDNSKRNTSARKTSIQTAMTPTGSPRASQTRPAVVPIASAVVLHRETRLLPPLSVKPILSPIQVARVNMPYKSNRSFRSFDEESHRHATTRAKEIKSEIDVSKKDLLFYIDDSHFRRKNPHSAVSFIVGRSTYEPANIINEITINGRKKNTLPTEKSKLRNSVKEEHSDVKQSSNYDLNQNNRRNNQLDIKTQSHPDDEHEAVETDLSVKHDRRYDNIQDDKDIEQTENKNDGDHKQKEVQFDTREKQPPNSLYKDRPDEKDYMKQNDKRNLPALSENSSREAEGIKKQPENIQINVSVSPNRNHEMRQETQLLNIKNDVQQNNQANREQKLYDEGKKVPIDNRKQFRRSNRRRNHRRNHDRNHKYIEQFDSSQHGESADDKDTQHSLKQEEQPQINRNSRNIYMRKEYNESKLKKHIPHESSLERKVQLKYEQSEQSNEQSYNVHKTYDSGRKNSPNKRKRKRHQSEESDIQKSNQPDKQSDDDNSLYIRNINDDKTTDKVIVKKSTLRSTKTVHRRHIRKKLNKKINEDNKQSDSDNHNENNFNNNMHGDTSHDELKGDHNEDKNQQYKDQKSQYVDSMDNEDFDKFDGRRMNRPSNETQSAQEIDVQDSECNNSQHGCFGEKYKKYNEQSITANVQELTSPTAKYKLLKVRAAGGSRRSITGERQFIQERGPKGVALFALDGAPFPQFRLPRSRRQYMDDHADKRPPLIEQISRRSLNRKHSRHHNNHQD